jgi:hypothetical protein
MRPHTVFTQGLLRGLWSARFQPSAMGNMTWI